MFTKILSYPKKRYERWLTDSLLLVNVPSLLATIFFTYYVLNKTDMLVSVVMMCFAMFLALNTVVILNFISETRYFRDALYFRIDADDSRVIATTERFLERNRYTCSIEMKNGTKNYWISDPDATIKIIPGIRSVAVTIGAVTPDNERRLRKLLGELRESMGSLTKVWQGWSHPTLGFKKAERTKIEINIEIGKKNRKKNVKPLNLV